MEAVQKLNERSLKERIKLLVPEEQLNKIKYLCDVIHNVEWSGILFYKMTGTIRDIKTVSFEMIDVLLMDRGDGGSTSYDFDNDVADYIIDRTMENPELWGTVKIGHIHSHHNMATFFSGTDMSELAINCNQHNFYLSLIVNNRLDLIAKLVYKVLPCAYQAYDESGVEYELEALSIEEPQMWVHDCDVEMPRQSILVSDLFIKRAEEIIKKPKVQKNLPVNYTGHTQTHQSWDKTNPSQSSFDKLVGQGGNSSKKEVKANEKPTEKITDIITIPSVTDLDEKFACYIIRLGELFPEDDLDQALAVMQDEGIDGNKLVNGILPKIGELYTKFMIKFQQVKVVDEIEMDDFLRDIATVNDLLTDYEGKFPFVIPLIKELDDFIQITEHAWRKAVFGDDKEQMQTVE